ncbi:flagellar hook-basal body complex protein [Magnetospirillum sp. SS-4]|uniref:flagellar hook-basal body complex protein n=1 Tax=Magnetospirillum sp. SS-4 TaxID=2681465 RepID=UPI00138096CF|nr:flagellar hook-basal body complex protein [Magnetospirillum sp. SS-4]CAA7615495.1 hypothetical protein MTBSS4_130035 [Magnetospirillum sp. SS-4]
MLWGAFNNASQAMMTMDYAMGGISQNIANVNTNGYKRKDTLFKTMLSESHAAPGTSQNSPTTATATTGLDIFAVRAVDRTFITQQGIITPSNTWTDLGINGRGFFVITQPDSSGNPTGTASETDAQGTLYTRAGNFQTKAIDTRAYFTTAGGQYLMGWMADAQGRIDGVTTTASSPVSATTTTTTAGGGGASLAPIYYQPGQLIDGISTTIIQPVMNLPANAPLTASPQTFTDSTSVTDGFGVAQDLTMHWSRVDGDNWTVTFSLPTAPANGSIGTIDPLSSPLTVKLDADGDIVSYTNSAGTVTAGSVPTLDITWAAGGTLATSPSVNLAGSKPTFEEVPLTLTAYDEAFNPQSLPVAFERAGNGQWYMRVKLPASGGSVDEFSSDSGGGGTDTYSVPVTFDGAGKILTPASITMGVSWTPSVTATTPEAVQIPAVLASYASQISAAVNGVTKPTLPATAADLATYEADLVAALTAIVVAAPATAADLTTYGEDVAAAYSDASDATQTAMDEAAAAAGSNTITFKTDKITQFSAEAPDKIGIKVIDQDGYASGVMDSASFISTGELIGHFSNGRTRTLAMVPVASFVAADQLDAISGTLFRRTERAGDMEVASIASQGSGAQIVASAVETSNVDLADEFTRMIITQKAYSMNATVFRTADEMTSTARDLF